MYWFAMEPLVADHPREGLALALDTKLPKILNFTTRRVALLATSEARDIIADQLANVTDSSQQLEMLTGLAAALKGQRNVTMPNGWAAIETALSASPNTAVRALAETISLTFGSAKARLSLRKTMIDPDAPSAVRLSALDSLLTTKDEELPPVLVSSLNDAVLKVPHCGRLPRLIIQRLRTRSWKFIPL